MDSSSSRRPRYAVGERSSRAGRRDIGRWEGREVGCREAGCGGGRWDVGRWEGGEGGGM